MHIGNVQKSTTTATQEQEHGADDDAAAWVAVDNMTNNTNEVTAWVAATDASSNKKRKEELQPGEGQLKVESGSKLFLSVKI